MFGELGLSPVFWQVGSSATLGTGTRFVGTIMALATITANTSATIHGRLLAQTGAVNLDTNTITASNCPSSVTGSGGGTETIAGPGAGGGAGGGGSTTAPSPPGRPHPPATHRHRRTARHRGTRHAPKRHSPARPARPQRRAPFTG
jgi:hypothetical protein